MQAWFSCRETLPELVSARATLRELQASDAPSLLAMLGQPDVRRFLSQQPTSLQAVEKFIEWTHKGRQAGRHLCYGVVPTGSTAAAGLFQVSSMEPTGRTVEWGFVLGPSLWGKALFQECAAMLVSFVIDALGVQRLEARAAVSNTRGMAALGRLGAVREGILRRCFYVDGALADHAMWSILATDWQRHRASGTAES